ncbi:MAG: tRNA (N(6)-L-threonylcarbamoyladenosine(37)-C(2))-methylthiotransferase MtaB [Pseudomonadota bacterium]
MRSRDDNSGEPELVTFGCRLNTFESEIMRARAEEAGLKDAVIFNTCAVTSEAVRQARQAIRKTRRERQDAKIIVTGCAAQIESAAFADMPEVDQVLGNEDKFKAGNYRPGAGRVEVQDIMQARSSKPALIGGFSERTRAFVQVQNGCDHRCTFCIIPFGRGNSRSVTPDHVVTQVRTLVENGYKEVVLTGVDLTSYGPDLGPEFTLGRLVRRVLAEVPELKRLRLSSIDSIEADADLMRAIAEEERLMPHLHLSLQAGDNMILKRMKRRHAREDAIAFCAEARRLRPDMVFGADIIAGFPTETEAMFENSLRLVEDCGLVQLHVFPFSPRPGTPAARMPQVDGAVRKERAARLRALGDERHSAWLARQVGTRTELLMETETRGRTRHHAGAVVAAALPVGEIVTAEIEGVSRGMLNGRLAA